MRLRSLRLLSFGPFRDKQLRFDGSGIEVVFGPNEAGKSTTRRAVLGLLYGIPERSKDGHTHGEMSIGATLEDDAGKTFDVVRTKGRKTTLRTPKNEPLDEQLMTKLLGGMNEATYLLTCGLDHELLRRGGDALRMGNGELGETLFAAATGLSGLHRVKTQLAEEADRLYAPRAKRPLNEAMKAFAEARTRASEFATSADTWHAQKQQIAKARAELDALRKEHAAKTEERARARVIAKAAADLETSRGRLREAHEALVTTRAELGAIESGGDLLNHAHAIEKLKASLAVHRKAAADRPKIAADLEATEAKARRARQAAPANAVSRLPAAGHVRKLAEEGTTLRERGRSHERRAAETELTAQRARERLGDMADARDPAELAEALDSARREGNIEARARDARQLADREMAAAKTRIAALGIETPTLEAVIGLPVPTRDVIASHARSAARTKDDQRVIADKRHELENERAEIERAIALLRAEGDLPTDEELVRARADRDALFRDVKEGKPKPLVVAAYERAVRGADDVADRLRREASRVTRLRELEAGHASIARKTDALAARDRSLAEEAEGEQAAWRALWTGIAVELLPPDQMSAWVSRWEAATAAAVRAIDARAAAAPLEAMVESARAALASALAKEGENVDADAPLSRLEQIGSRVLKARKDAATERAKLDAERMAAERDRDRAASERATFQHDLVAWSAQWAAVTLALGLPEASSPEQATAALEAISLLAHVEDEAEKTRKRIAGIDRDAKAFSDDVRALCETCAADLRDRPVDEAAAELSDRLGRAREEHARRKTLAEREAKLDAQAREIGALVEKQSAELESAEDAQSAEARVAGLDARIDELHEAIQKATHSLGGLEAGAKQFDQSRAVDYAAEAQRQLAKIGDLAEQYARSRLAAAAVTRLLERYRRDNQGPVLSRASELFTILTLGSFEGLEVGFDHGDEPVLVAVRDKKQLEASALSDGTLDQLYLALRVASLERLVESRGPLPLLLDDVLVHFDDQRAAAALSVLADLAKKTQVILFTHHRRVVDLATRAISDRDGATAARVHELAP